MVDLRGFIDVCVLTNGRESFKQVIQSLEAQVDVKFDLHVVKNKNIIDACNDCLNYSDASFFIKVDDDMILHPMTLKYYFYRVGSVAVSSFKHVAIYGSILWEPWNGRYCNILKAYDRRIAKKIGFKPDARGKIDKVYRQACKARNYAVVKEKSVVGIHAACKASDNMKYCELFGCTKDPKFSIRRKEIKFLDEVYKKVPLSQQLELANKKLYEENRKINSLFYQFVESEK